jgi:acyl-CoA reductase-like NAD-dependent aldehyde dehydrogenase
MTLTAQPKIGKLLINGKWRDASSGELFGVENPATESIITEVAKGTIEDTDAAVAAAKAALEDSEWSRMAPADRGRILYKIAQNIGDHIQEISELITLENGKTIGQSKYEANFTAEVFEYYAGWPTKYCGETMPSSPMSFYYTLREPVGVVATISPWNFPVMLQAWKIAAALAVGCTVVAKPASYTPLGFLKMAELCQEAGLPDGVFNVVVGPGSTVGTRLVEHPDVAAVAFTGETTTGIDIMQRAAGTLKRIHLELGGKSPFIIFPDADLDAAARAAAAGIFTNKGEVCTATSRLLVNKSIHDKALYILEEETKEKFQPGDPLDPKTGLGPLAARSQLDKVLGFIEKGHEQGAILRTGGTKADVNGDGTGYFVYPTIFEGVDNSMDIAQQEIFGPVLSVIDFDDVDEVIRIANQSEFGLASQVWTQDLAKAHYVAKKLQAGMVQINGAPSGAPYTFGGYKMSGFGKDLGREALDHYTNVKSVRMNINF